MIETFLIPEKTVVTAKGEGQPIDISAAKSRVFLISLKITETVEQEAFDVSVFGSADGTTWDAKPIIAFPQRFHRGETPLLLDLTTLPAIKHVRANWDVNRWGRGPEEAMFELGISLREVQEEVLADMRREAAARK
jgi:hypothetical protein